MKQRIRLTESDLHRMIKESVRQVLTEEENPVIKLNGKMRQINFDNENDDMYYEQRFNDAEDKLHNAIIVAKQTFWTIVSNTKNEELKSNAMYYLNELERLFK